ncbi:MAG: hypothetical protein Q8P41_25385 [Pseudomonadota bacterium]|nr:hypothetical protein [Pseudomonadota bacterium]
MLLLLIVGCSGDKDAAVEDSGEETDTQADDSGTPAAAPIVQGINFTSCAPNTDDIDTWSVSVDVDDPQGDVASTGSSVSVMDGETTLATYLLACSPDTCSGGWTATTDGIGCDAGRAAMFRFVIVDDFGNASAPFDYQPV